MASIQEIKRRTKAVHNTRAVTRAMEMVSATKMRRSQEIALLSRPYALYVLRLLAELKKRTEYEPAIAAVRPVKNAVLILMSSDRGLAGSFNANIMRRFEEATKIAEIDGAVVSYIAVGKKSEEFLTRKGVTLLATFKNFGDFVDPHETRGLSELLVGKFLNAEIDRVVVASTHFRSTLRQEVMIREVLPVNPDKLMASVKELAPEYGRYSGESQNVVETIANKKHEHFEYLIEPSPEMVLDELAPELVHTIMYHLVLEANASEHSARMVAMKNASENASELKDALTLEFNKLRQAGITREVSEIVGGTEALQS